VSEEEEDEGGRVPVTPPPLLGFAPDRTATRNKETKKKKGKSKKPPVPRTPPPKKHPPAGGPLGSGTGTARPRAKGTLQLTVCSLFAQPPRDVTWSCRWGSEDSHPVVGSVVELFDAGGTSVVSAFVAANGASKTDATGKVTLKIGSLPDGDYVLRLNPPEGHELRGAMPGPITDPVIRNVQLRPVGPADAFFNDPPKHTRFRVLEIRITITNNVLDKEKVALVQDMRHPEAVAPHGAVAAESESSLVIDWKPDWVQCGFATKLKKKQVDPARPDRTLSPVQFIVLHHNDATTPGSTLDHFSDEVNNKHKTGAHYLVDIDGHVIKMAHETITVRHAGECFWYGLDSYQQSSKHVPELSWNDISIGVEQVNKDSSKYPFELVATVDHERPHTPRKSPHHSADA
jgi:hypothetical protein